MIKKDWKWKTRYPFQGLCLLEICELGEKWKNILWGNFNYVVFATPIGERKWFWGLKWYGGCLLRHWAPKANVPHHVDWSNRDTAQKQEPWIPWAVFQPIIYLHSKTNLSPCSTMSFFSNYLFMSICIDMKIDIWNKWKCNETYYATIEIDLNI